MFKKIKDRTKKLIALHSAGATVRHKGHFSNLKVIENQDHLDRDFINKYVVPFYMIDKGTKEFRKAYMDLRDSIDVNLVSKLLGEFNWRPRSVGAYFAAIESMNELEENIGKLLLRSDVCYSGKDYCIALASFSTPAAIQFLHQYLEYYLGQPDLWFDQGSAMAALTYIGNQINDDLAAIHLTAWERFIANKPNWDLSYFIEGFAKQMYSLNELKHEISS